MCLMLSTSYSALVDAQAELLEGAAYLSKVGMIPCLAPQPQSLNDVAKTTELAKGLTGFSPWIYMNPYKLKPYQNALFFSDLHFE